MDLDSGPMRIWLPEELGVILQHQMSAMVQFDLSSLDSSIASKLSNLSTSQGLLLKSFDDLFHHPNPPIELLILTKDFAKASRNHPDSALPHEIAMVLYFLSIVVALIRCKQRITQLNDNSLHQGVQWAISQEWLDKKTQNLFKEGSALLEKNAEGGNSE